MNNDLLSRRRALSRLLQISAVVPLSGLFGNLAMAQDLPLVALDDPMAKALGYAEDSTTVDAAKYPKHTADQLCSNCQFYQGDAAAESGPCTLFPGKSVKAKGWCVSWVKKAG